MDELIHKQDAIKAICEDGTWLERQGCTEITMAERKQRDVDILEALPPVQPQEIINLSACVEYLRKNGWKVEGHTIIQNRAKWLINTDGYYPYCSRCKAEPKNGVMSDFCPSCGADMRGKADGRTDPKERCARCTDGREETLACQRTEGGRTHPHTSWIQRD